jgi:pyruvate/2-oxoacid:ferredoxin oxidoreductase alpha subunit
VAVCVEGNEAVARVAYALSETVALYPITLASPTGEHADAWSTAGRPNVWGVVPAVAQLQSEAGAAAALHGAIQAGSLGVTFTASHGLLLMLPEMLKIAGEQTPTVPASCRGSSPTTRTRTASPGRASSSPPDPLPRGRSSSPPPTSALSSAARSSPPRAR